MNKFMRWFSYFFIAYIFMVLVWSVAIRVSDHEPLPLMGLQSRTIPYVKVADVEIVVDTKNTAYNAFGVIIENRSVYPITSLTVRCKAKLKYTGELTDTIQYDGVILPGHTKSFSGGFAGYSAAWDDEAQTASCVVDQTTDPFSHWSGIDPKYSYLDWEKGYVGKILPEPDNVGTAIADGFD